MKKILAFVIFSFLLVFATEFNLVSAATQEAVTQRALSYSAPETYPEGVITKFQSAISLDQRGNAEITEKIVVYFPNPKRGIFRWIPQRVKIDDIFLEQPISLKSVSYQKIPAINEGSHPIARKYSTEESTRDYLVIRIGDPDVYLTGAYEYTITYKMKRAVRFLENSQELYLNITGSQWEIPILEAEANITPAPKHDITVCYTGKTGSTRQDCQITINNGSVSVRSTTSSNDAVNGLTAGIQYEQSTFLPPTKFELFLENTLPLTPLLIPFFVFFYAFNKWRKYGKDTRISTIPPLYIPTKEMEGTNLSICNSLLRMRAMPIMATAELIRLAEKGFITIRYEKKKLFLELTEKQQEKLPTYLETQPISVATLVKTLTQNFQPVTQVNLLKNIHVEMQRANKQAKEEFEAAHFIVPASVKWQRTYIAFAVVLGILSIISFGFISEVHLYRWFTAPMALVVSSAIFGLFSITMLQRNKRGDELTRDLLGLKRYIKAAELKRLEFFNNPKKMVDHFEQILPYAIILQLDRQWTKEFGPILERLQYQPSWLVSDMPISRSLPITYAAMSSTLASSINTLSTPPQPSSSSFGGGGGFSGGGSGGGGGGSW